jgi:hypothetical protein
MRGILFLKHFFEVIEQEGEEKKNDDIWDGGNWTKFLRSVMLGVGEKINCEVIQLGTEDIESKGERLNIDAFFIDKIDKADFELTKNNGWGPFVLPRAVVELENDIKHDKISYDLWKILCIRAPIRVLVCYQGDAGKVKTLRKKLEDVIWRGSLMKGTDGDLLVIIGDQTVKYREGDWDWSEYFTIFEWRNDRLEKVEGLE